jgi:DnaJ-class molecular chaperone
MRGDTITCPTCHGSSESVATAHGIATGACPRCDGEGVLLATSDDRAEALRDAWDAGKDDRRDND